MPAIVTHHIFGSEVYDACTSAIGNGKTQRLAFLLGNMGPDPLFCMKMLPKTVAYRNLGSLMHREKPAQLLSAVHERFIVSAPANVAGDAGSANGAGNANGNGSSGGSRDNASAQKADAFHPPSWMRARGQQLAQHDEPGVARAYALGFLCHYLLDSMVHPLVYAQEKAICKIVVKGLDVQQLAGAAHALIETELDEYVLSTKLGLTVKEFVPHQEILACPDWALATISSRMANVVADAYGLDIPKGLFQTNVHLYRGAQFVLDSKRTGIRSRFDYARIVGRKYPHVLALSHEAKRRLHTMFANDDRVPWEHPFEEGMIMGASFDNLYDAAFKRALEAVPAFAQESFPESACIVLTGDINFKGQHR